MIVDHNLDREGTISDHIDLSKYPADILQNFKPPYNHLQLKLLTELTNSLRENIRTGPVSCRHKGKLYKYYIITGRPDFNWNDCQPAIKYLNIVE